MEKYTLQDIFHIPIPIYDIDELYPIIIIIKELSFLKFQSKHTINCKNIIFKRN